jgi:hypothetical protein
MGDTYMLLTDSSKDGVLRRIPIREELDVKEL